MENEKLNFINNEFPLLLKQLTDDTMPKWGMMNARQMVEHLTDYIRIANGKNPEKVVTPEEQLPAFRRFLESEKQFRPDTKNPLNTGAPRPLRLNSLEDAITEYKDELSYFYSVFEKEPGKITSHPAFGPCNYDDWIKLHFKHLSHHARQFGLIGE